MLMRIGIVRRSGRWTLRQSAGHGASCSRAACLSSRHRFTNPSEHTMNPPDLSSLNGLRVAVTGGTSGLGLALVKALRARGAEVAFIARDAARVAAVARDVPGSHGIAGDVSRKTDTHALAIQIANALGGPAGAANNPSS